MADLKERLLPPKPALAFNVREGINRPTASGRKAFQRVDVVEVKKRGQGLKSWIRVDTSGNSQVIEVDKFTMVRLCDLPARDLRLLDPVFVYPSTILGREKAIVVNLEQILCIITEDEVLLLNSLDKYALQYVIDLQRRLKTTGVGEVSEVWQSDHYDMNQRRGNRNFENLYWYNPLCIFYGALGLNITGAHYQNICNKLQCKNRIVLPSLKFKMSYEICNTWGINIERG